MSDSSFPALPGAYKALFLYIEPVVTIMAAVPMLFTAGAVRFYHNLVPDPDGSFTSVDARTRLVITQLGTCWLLMGMLTFLTHRAVRNALPGNPAAQERIHGAIMLSMLIVDVIHIPTIFIGLPDSLKYHPELWNVTIHGNISLVIVLLLFRVAWFLGIGRTRYHFGQGLTPSSGRAKYN